MVSAPDLRGRRQILAVHTRDVPLAPGVDLDGVAPATKELVDAETRRIIEECYEQAVTTLRGNRDRLDRLAHTLLDGKPWTKTRRTPRPASAATPPPPRSRAARRDDRRQGQRALAARGGQPLPQRRREPWAVT
jgi:SpoVK/Ycf46/Vps4 family AAA+-type ATPase